MLLAVLVSSLCIITKKKFVSTLTVPNCNFVVGFYTLSVVSRLHLLYELLLYGLHTYNIPLI